MTEAVSVFRALAAVMDDVGAVRKGDQNQAQGFNFRGVDSVVNAVSPALRRHGVVVVPDVLDVEHGSVEVGRNRTLMGHVRVRVRYTFHGPAGDSIACSVVAEAMDAGDKATPKAMSVAFRTALLQALCLPTDEPDPDSVTYERSSAPEPADERLSLINAIGQAAGERRVEILEAWAASHNGEHIRDATDLGGLQLVLDDLKAGV